MRKLANPQLMVLLLGAFSGTMVVLIHFECFPPAVFVHLRSWWLHFFALVAVSLTTGVMLGLSPDTKDADLVRRLRLACLVPFTFLALHEWGQWLWPPSAETPDCLRDLAMNALGTVVAWMTLMRCRPRRRAEPPRARMTPPAPPLA